jgi:hypothetical protein
LALLAHRAEIRALHHLGKNPGLRKRCAIVPPSD